MTLADELSGCYADLYEGSPVAPPKVMKDSIEDFKTSFDPDAIVRAGQPMPEFRLKNVARRRVSSADFIASGPILFIFYWGVWCPLCNIELRAYQKHLDEFSARGATLLAISPELVEHSLSLQERNGLQFPVLSDEGNVLAHKLGIVVRLPDTLRPMNAAANVDLIARNGDDSFEVPIPATYLVDRQGIIRNAYVEPDFTRRLEPAVALAWIDALAG